ncbi:uncharacterized protein LOC134779058 isoform X2 [Penaeus indicus]|uniref:uncharacterized protein LOC134779058 isoform X2 n=1 Tax=Penaeus indicus TaxID=29960 RepID=UPI00300D8442
MCTHGFEDCHLVFSVASGISSEKLGSSSKLKRHNCHRLPPECKGVKRGEKKAARGKGRRRKPGDGFAADASGGFSAAAILRLSLPVSFPETPPCSASRPDAFLSPGAVRGGGGRLRGCARFNIITKSGEAALIRE